MSYKISIECIEKSKDPVSGEICGGSVIESHERVRIDHARKLARKLSLNDTFHEVMLLKPSEDDPLVQEYWKKGEMICKMF